MKRTYKRNLNIELNGIDTLRRTGVVTKAIEVAIKGDKVYGFPPHHNRSDEIVDAIISEAELGKPIWCDEGRAKRRGRKKKLLGYCPQCSDTLSPCEGE